MEENKLEISKLRYEDWEAASKLELPKEELEEAIAFGFIGTEQALIYTFAYSELIFRVTVGGVLLGLFGLSRHPGNNEEGVPWFVCNEDLKYHSASLLENLKAFLEYALTEKCRLLKNVVNIGNRKSIAFLRKLGFKIDYEDTVEKGGLTFAHYSMRLERNNTNECRTSTVRGG